MKHTVRGYVPIGHIAAGKDTFFSIVQERYPCVVQGAFATELKRMSRSLGHLYKAAFRALFVDKGVTLSRGNDHFVTWNSVVSEAIDNLDKTYFRGILQQLGTEEVRNRFGQDSWVEALRNTSPLDQGKMVITDCRFPNEIRCLEELGYLPVLLNVQLDVLERRFHTLYNSGGMTLEQASAKYRELLAHGSEGMTKDLLNQTIPNSYTVVENNGSLADFRSKVYQLMDEYPIEKGMYEFTKNVPRPVDPRE